MDLHKEPTGAKERTGAKKPKKPGRYRVSDKFNTIQYYDGVEWTPQTQPLPPKPLGIMDVAVGVAIGMCLAGVLLGLLSL